MNNPQDKNQIPVAACPVSVAYRRMGRTWHATALQFDLVGTGRTRKAAYEELRGVVELYLTEVLKTKGPVRLFNLAEENEWGNSDQEHYQLVILIDQKGLKTKIPAKLTSLENARKYRSSLRSVSLQPSSCV